MKTTITSGFPRFGGIHLAAFTGMGLLLIACGGSRQAAGSGSGDALAVKLDLVNIDEDRVRVTVAPGEIDQDTITYVMAKIIPGTYAIQDYGRFLENFEALDASGNSLPVRQTTTNTWLISDAGKLARITYLVNDSFDQETDFDAFSADATTIFSPAGTNIQAGENFVLNMSGFVGYLQGKARQPYSISIAHPASLKGASALVDLNATDAADLFTTKNYAELVDSPIMYSKSEPGTFMLDDMEVILAVHSPVNQRVNARSLLPDLRTMMAAQKNYLGEINNTKKYAVLNYITSMGEDDAKGIGALEHNFSTTGVFRENMTSQDLRDVISHEFFHTLTPLNVHSKEIHYFDFLNPKMSRHLWMYEGFTEYFAQHFQVHEGLMTEEEFFAVIMEKITTSKSYDDTLSFTTMSRNVLDPKFKDQYPNVYMKGALMAMCMDIIIREHSGGSRSLLSVMGELADIYGPEKPFDDAELIPKFTEMTYPEIGEFIQKNIVEGAVIDYDAYLARVGVEPVTVPVVQQIAFIIGQVPYVKLNPAKTQFMATLGDGNNKFYQAMGIQEDDVLVEVNGTPINPENKPIDEQITNGLWISGYKLGEGSPVTMKVQRNGELITLEGESVENYADGPGYQFGDEAKRDIKDMWLYK